MNDILSGLTDRDFKILNCIHKHGPITKSGLIEKTDLKLSTLNRSMKLLIGRRLVFERGISDSTGGRRPSKYDIAREGLYSIGVDISRTFAQVVIMNLKIEALLKYTFHMDSGMSPVKCVDRIADAIELLLSKLSIDKSMVLGIGVGTIGPMNRKDGILLHPKGFLNPEWDDDVPIKELVEKQTGIACEIDNGANTAALVEYLFGMGRGYQCIAHIQCGVGLRSAVIRDGVILRTMNDREDAFAHMTVKFNGASCRCGGKGCLENYVSLESIRRGYQTDRQISYDELFSLAANNDSAANEAFKFSAKILGIGISNLARLLNPDLVILSGPLISDYPSFYSICVDSFRRHNKENTLIFSKEGAYKDSGVAVGAGLMIIEHNFKQTGKHQ